MTGAAAAPTITLANGIEIPHIGLGTASMSDQQASATVAQAIRAGVSPDRHR